jgi:hypothetical protein
MEDTTITAPINGMTDDEIRQELTDNGVTLHHKTGTKKLASTLAQVRTKEYKEDVKPVEEDIPEIPANVRHRSLPGSTPASRAAKAKRIQEVFVDLTEEQKAMKLIRIVVNPNDTLMASYPGLIFTVGSSRLSKNGEMIKKFVPFNNEAGWHVPKIIYDQINAAEMQKFRTVTSPNGEKILEPYLTKKFNVRILPELSVDELEKLAASQQVAGFNVGANN